MSIFSGTLGLGPWIPARGHAATIVFAALCGFGFGAFVSLLSAIIAEISDVKEIGTRTGIEFAIMSVAALVSKPRRQCAHYLSSC
jgi:MFS family permease